MQAELPGGEWAELMEPDDLRDGDRKAVLRAVDIPRDDDKDVNAGFMDRLYDALLERVVKNWSFQLPLPSQAPQALDALTIKQARALRKAAEPHYNLVMDNEEEDPTEGSGS